MAGTRVSRRSMLGTVGAAALAPALVQASPGRPLNGAPLPHASPLFAAQLEVAALVREVAGAHVAITGGTLRGRALAGVVVQGGHIQWQPQVRGMAVTVRFGVRLADGSLVEVCERGLLADCNDITDAAVISTVPEPPGPDSEAPASPALRVGRLDATRLQQGMVRLVAFEVS